MRLSYFAKSHILIAALILSIYAAHGLAANQSTTPDQLPGLWAQVDEKTSKVQSLVRIVEISPERYEGFVEKIYAAPGEDANPRCEDCKGARKNQPVLGMRIITGLKRSGSDRFDDGEILDPDSGDTYRLRIILLDAGKKLDVRGFIGIALFGRSQVWLREAVPSK